MKTRVKKPVAKAEAAATRPTTFAIPPVAIAHLGVAMEEGRQKYGLFDWRERPDVRISSYLDALNRHIMAYRDGEDLDPDSEGGRVPHLAKAMATLAILLDADACGVLEDDRGPVGCAAEVLANMIAN